MIVTVSARRRAQDLDVLLAGGRASSPAAAAELARLVALAHRLEPPDVQLRPQFRTQLRQRLVAEAGTRTPAPRAPVTRDGRRERPAARQRARQAVATIALASVVTGAGVAAASSRALPGDPLYGLKRQVEVVELALARGELGQGRERLEQADARLGEAEALAAGATSREPATDARVRRALNEFDAALVAGAGNLTRAYRETGDEEPMLLLARFAVRGQDRLDDLTVLLDPALRARARQTSAMLAQLANRAEGVLGGRLAAGALGSGLRGTTDRLAAAGPDAAESAQRTAGQTRPGRPAGAVPVPDPAGAAAPGSAGSAGGSAGMSGSDAGSGPLRAAPSSAPVSSAPVPAQPGVLPTLPVPDLLPSPTTTSAPAPSSTSPTAAPTLPALPSVSVSVCLPVLPLTSC